MADESHEHKRENDDHYGDYAKRHDHFFLLSAGNQSLSEAPPEAAFSIFSRFGSRFAPSWSAFS